MDITEIATFAAALLAVLAMIMAIAWVLKRFFGGAARPGQPALRRRNRRLGIVEAAQIGNRHRLLLVRRDDREHLILIGGSTELVIETDIPHPEAEAEVNIRSVEPRFDAAATEREPVHPHAADRGTSRGYGEEALGRTSFESFRSRIGDAASHLDHDSGYSRHDRSDDEAASEPAYGRGGGSHDDDRERPSYLRSEPSSFARTDRGVGFEERSPPPRREEPAFGRFDTSDHGHDEERDPRYERGKTGRTDDHEDEPEPTHSRILSRFLKKDGD